MTPPNILYVHSHDTGRWVQPYGYQVPTPNIQHLADQGVLFRQAFSGAPVCSGSRAALLTGEWSLLLEQATKPQYTVRFKWEPGSVAFWDNRATSHLGPQDIDHLDVARTLHRVTLIGEVPVGVDGTESVLVAGSPFQAAPLFEPGHVASEG